MQKRLWTIIVALGVIASLALAACQGGTPTTTSPEPEEAPAGEAAGSGDAQGDREPVTLTFIKIADELESQAYEEMIQAFHESENGRWAHVTIEYDAKPFSELFRSIETAVATGTPVDLIQADGPDVKHFAFNNVLMDLTDHFSEEELSAFPPQSLEEASFEGRFYGPPQNQSCQLAWYNQDMVDAAGIELQDTEGLTYGPDGTGLPVWQKLTKDENGDGTPEVYGYQIGGWYDYLNGIAPRTNGEPGSPTFQGVSEDGTGFVGYFDTPEAIEAYQFDQDMMLEYKVASNEPPVNAMLSGFAAMSVMQDMVLGTLEDQFPDFNIGAMYPPYWQTPICHTGSWHYGIATTTDNFEEALAFVKFASSIEGQRIMYEYKGQMPSNLELLNSLPEYEEYPRSLIKDFFIEHGQPRITTPAYTEFGALFSEFYQSLVTGGDVAELTHEYARLMEEAAQKYAR